MEYIIDSALLAPLPSTLLTPHHTGLQLTRRRGRASLTRCSVSRSFHQIFALCMLRKSFWLCVRFGVGFQKKNKPDMLGRNRFQCDQQPARTGHLTVVPESLFFFFFFFFQSVSTVLSQVLCIASHGHRSTQH